MGNLQTAGQVPQSPPVPKTTVLEDLHNRMLKLEQMSTEARITALRFQDRMDGSQPHDNPEVGDERPSGLIPAMEGMIGNIEASLSEIMSTFAKY